MRFTDRDEVDDLVRKGKDLERIVLARAVRSHLQNRVLVYGNRTVSIDFSKSLLCIVRDKSEKSLRCTTVNF